MKKIYIILYVIMMFLLSSIVIGHDYNPLIYIECESDMNSATDVGNLTITGSPTYPAGVIGNACSGNSGVNGQSNTWVDEISVSEVKTLEWWHNPTNEGDVNNYFADGYIDGSDNYYFNDRGSGGGFQWIMETDGTPYMTFDGGIGSLTANWNHIVMTWNGTNINVYANGNYITTQVSTLFFNGNHTNFGILGGLVGNADGMMDNIAVWNDIYDQTDVTWSYNSGSGRNYTYTSPPSPASVSVVLSSPATGSTSNVHQNITYTGIFYNATEDNCSLYTNITGVWEINQTHDAINNSINSFNIGDFSTFGSYDWNVECYDVLGNNNISITNNTFINALNYTYGSIEEVIELSNYDYNFTINKTGISETDVALTYNGIIQTLTKTTYTEYDFYSVVIESPKGNGTNISLTWSYNVTGNGDLFKQNITLNQTINGIFIDNCSVYSTQALNFSMFRDDTDATISAWLKGYFKVWVAADDSYRDFNLSWADTTSHGMCIYPSDGNYSIYGQLEYDTAIAGEWATKSYYLYNATLDNVSETINLYLTPNTTAVTFSVNDENDDPVQDVYIHILKYDLATNSHTTNSIIKTGEDGEAIGEIILTTQWYKFILVYDGEIKLESDPVKISSTTRNFRISLQTDYFSHYDTAKDVLTSLTFTNSTGNFAYTWVNPTGISKTVCLKVIRRSISGDTTIGNTCETSASGTILVNIGETLDYTFIATGMISGSPFLLKELLEVSFEEGYKAFGKDGIFATFFLRLALALMGIWNPAIAIALLILADISMMVMGFYSWSWSVLVVYIIMAAVTIFKVGKK
jgi:hypothetical protein